MIRSFFDIPFLRIGQSSRMWFTPSDIASVLRLSKQSVKKTATHKKFDVARLHQYDAEFLKSDGKIIDNREVRHDRFGLDLLMYLVYKNNPVGGEDIRAWITTQISNLCLDGFTSLYNYNLDIIHRRALASYVCGASNYIDIVRDRYGRALRRRGMECYPGSDWELEDLANPDYYVSRVEITVIRAIDLAIHLLSIYHPVERTHDELFVLLGFDKERGTYLPAHVEDLIQWLESKEKESPYGA